MNLISNNLVNKLIEYNLIKSQDKEIYTYGIKQMLFLILNILTILILGIVFNKAFEFILFMLTYIPIRIYAGGYHAKNHIRCYIFLILICIIYILNIALHINSVITTFFVIISSIIIFVLAPIEDINKSLDNEEKIIYIKRTIRNLIVIISIYFVSLYFNLIDIMLCVCIFLFCNAIMLILGKIKNNFLHYVGEKMKNKFLKIIIILIIAFFNFNIVNASEIKKEVIFVLDASNSMKSFDNEKVVLDEIKKTVNFLTSEYKVGIVIYNTNIVDYANVNDDLAYLNSILDRTKYTGYTNAGEALEFALNMFSDDNIYKNIIMVSDGEIVLQNGDLTNESNETFKNAINICKQQNILVDTIALGELTEDGKKYNILDASNQTNGQVFKCDNILKLNEITNEILFNKFKIKKSLVGIGNTSSGEIDIKLSTSNLDKVKILISSNDKIDNINVNCKSESANVINGKEFAIIEINKPYEENINLKFNSKGDIETYLLQEYTANINSEIEKYYYENDTVKADISIYLDNKKGNIFNDDYYNNKTLNVKINDDIYEGIIQDKKINIPLDVLDIDENLAINLDLEEFEQNFLNINPINIKLDKIEIDRALEENKNDYEYLPLYIILSVLILVIILIILKNIDNRKKELVKQQKINEERERLLFKPKNPYTYSGKLNVYVINTEDGVDIAPQTFNLQRKETNQKINLKEILNACKINIGDDSSQNIIFEPAANKSLNLTNNSYATIIKNGSLVTFEKSVSINFNEKISIILEDEVTELEIHYKSLKPSSYI